MARDTAALIAWLDQGAHRRFRWGRDCVRFACDAVEVQTGTDPAPGLRWRTRREALAILDAEGGLIAAVDRRLQRVAPALARRGDIAGVPEKGAIGLRLMVIEGATLVAPGTNGHDRQPRSAMTIAWSAEAVVPHG